MFQDQSAGSDTFLAVVGAGMELILCTCSNFFFEMKVFHLIAQDDLKVAV